MEAEKKSSESKDWSPLYYTDLSVNNGNVLLEDCVRIGFCPDWRCDPEKGPFYPKWIFEYYQNVITEHEAKMVVLKFDDTAAQYRGLLHGWIIPGGRDLNPMVYGQKNTDSKYDEPDASQRYEFCKDFLFNSEQQMPILGICYGFQVINCLLGGDLIQHMPTASDHVFKVNQIEVVSDSELHRIIDSISILGTCFHHQGIGHLSPQLTPIATCQSDKTIHAAEFAGPRNILCVLWHPEQAYSLIKSPAGNRANLQIFTHFFMIAHKYRLKQRLTQD